jgi:hypothetical protein
MKRKHFLMSMPFVFGLLLTSCSALFTGTKDEITFNSTPAGAVVYKDGIELCKTPCAVSIKRSLGDTKVEMKLDGYQTRVFTLDKAFNVVSVLNLGNLLGWGIDAATGAIMKYDKKNYTMELSKEKRVSSLQPEKIYIDTKKNTVDVYVTK